MSKITPVITSLPMYKVPLTYVGGTTPETPFYFQKKQCERDCFFGTITDTKHLPSFIVRVPFNENPNLQLHLSSDIDFELVCADGTNVTSIIPEYRWTAKSIVTSSTELFDISTQIGVFAPQVGDTYYFDDGVAPVEFYVWNGAGWNQSGQINPIEGDLMNLTDTGFVVMWFPDEDSTETNPARQGEWKKTVNGFQLCDIGEFTYLIYNGFSVTDGAGLPLPCGLQQVRISFPDFPDIEGNGMYLSELVDVKDFNPVDNVYHKLTFTNGCNLGNIPFENILFKQRYYFNEDTLVGEPEYETEEEKEEDGLGNEKKIFSRTSKLFQLDTLSVPEYIVDFFTFATQCDEITITFPMEYTNRLTTLSPYKGERCIDNDSMSADADWIASGCYAQVNLKFALVDDIIETACCQQLDKEGCLTSSFDVQGVECYDQQELIESVPPSVGDCFLIRSLDVEFCPVCDVDCNEWHDHPEEIACYQQDGSWTYTQPFENMIVTDVNDNGTQWFWTSLSGWKVFSSVECGLFKTTSSITVHGFVPSTVVTGYLYYRRKTTQVWILAGIYQHIQLAGGILVSGLPQCGVYEFKILGLSNNCDYGEGDIYPCTTLVDETC